jgi:hypothetical protein
MPNKINIKINKRERERERERERIKSGLEKQRKTTATHRCVYQRTVNMSAGKSGFVGNVPLADVAHNTMQSRILAAA